jgi:multiple sugar transport system permease protein
MYASDRRLALVFAAPAALVLAGVFLYPMGLSLQLSFLDYSLITGDAASRFVGISHFVAILSDTRTLESLWRTGVFVVTTLAAELVLGLGLALGLQERLRLRGLTRTALLAPMMTSSIVVGLMWRLLWNADYGAINAVLEVVHLPRPFWLGPDLAFWSIVITEIWQQTPFVCLILLAGLASVPVEPLEAASIDGASYLQRLAYITLPLLRPVLLVVIVFRAIFALRSIEAVWVLTGGGPADSTLLFGFHIYRTAFRYFDLGFSSALSWLLVCIMLAFIGSYAWLLARARREQS